MNSRLLASLLGLVLLALPLFAAAEKAHPLKLADGRVFTEWTITGETASAVFVKYKGGGAKIAKKLLPPDVLAKYPIDDDAIKAEQAALAKAERAGNERKAMVEAARARDEEQRKATRATREQAVAAAVEAKRTEIAIARSVAAETPARALGDDPERLYALVRARAKRYYEAERRNGSGATLLFGINYEFDEPRPVPGWTERFEITGVAHYQFYDSVWGGSFSSHVGYFSAVIARGRVIDFTPRNGPAM